MGELGAELVIVRLGQSVPGLGGGAVGAPPARPSLSLSFSVPLFFVSPAEMPSVIRMMLFQSFVEFPSAAPAPAAAAAPGAGAASAGLAAPTLPLRRAASAAAKTARSSTRVRRSAAIGRVQRERHQNREGGG